MSYDGGSGSAILPTKKPPRQPLKLSLSPAASPGASTSTQPTGAVPSLDINPSAIPVPPVRPSLKLPTLGLASLSLSIPTSGNPPSRYRGTALNGPPSLSSESEENDEDDDDDDEGENARWGAGDQERMAGELLDVIRGPVSVGLEDELSGRTRRMREASTLEGRIGLGSRHASSSSVPKVGGSTSSPELPPSSSDRSATRQASPFMGGEDSSSAPQSAIDRSTEVTAATLKDLGRLGEGASGEVRKVMHRPTGVIMAKKTIATSPNPKLHKQHLRELLFMRDCSDPAIVQYYGAFLEENNTQISICMEYCEAGSLETLYKRVKARGWRTGEKVLGKIAESMISGLVYLHSQKIIHRDIKPSNVLVTTDGQIKLCDFGVSGELVNSFAGTFVGTTFYLSPERIRGGKYSITSDVWSMALTVLEVALNRFPFPGPGEAPLQSPIELLTYLIKLDTPRVDDEPENGIKYTNAFRNFIQVCLDKDPSTRPTPQRLVTHGWIRRSRERNPPPDLGRWVRDLE